MILRLVQMQRQSIHFAVVCVEFLEFYRFWVVKVDGLENRLNIILGKACIQPHQHVFEALVAEIAVAFPIVGLESAF